VVHVALATGDTASLMKAPVFFLSRVIRCFPHQRYVLSAAHLSWFTPPTYILDVAFRMASSDSSLVSISAVLDFVTVPCLLLTDPLVDHRPLVSPLDLSAPQCVLCCLPTTVVAFFAILRSVSGFFDRFLLQYVVFLLECLASIILVCFPFPSSVPRAM